MKQINFDVLDYETLLSHMIRDCRQKWGQGNFPCFCVQLPNYPNRYNFSRYSAFAQLREAQFKCSKSISDFNLVVTIDTAEETGGLHPKNKSEIGHRLAQMALATVYRHGSLVNSPSYDTMQISGNKILVSFQSVQDRLVVRGPQIYGFTIAGV